MSNITHSWLKVIGKMVLWLVLSGMTAWGALAIYFSYLPEPAKPILSVLFALSELAILLFLRPRRLAYAVFSGLFAIVLFGWFSMEPSNDRDWQADVALLSHAINFSSGPIGEKARFSCLPYQLNPAQFNGGSNFDEFVKSTICHRAHSLRPVVGLRPRGRTQR